MLIDLAYLVCFQVAFFSILGYLLVDVIYFLFVSCLLTFAFWLFCNRFLRLPGRVRNCSILAYILMEVDIQAADVQVEWLYAFDVHCNGFLLFALVNYVLRYVFLPFMYNKSMCLASIIIILKMTCLIIGWIALFFSNTLYFASTCCYLYITFLGYDILPFLRRTHYLLYLVFPVSAICLNAYRRNEVVLSRLQFGFYHSPWLEENVGVVLVLCL